MLLLLIAACKNATCNEASARQEEALQACGLVGELPRAYEECTPSVMKTMACEADCMERVSCGALMGPSDGNWYAYMACVDGCSEPTATW